MADREYVIRYDTANVPQSVAAINSLKAAIDALDASASKSKKSLGDVGKATAAIGRTDAKVKNLTQDLADLTAEAAKAAAALQSINGNIGKVGKSATSAGASIGKFVTAAMVVSEVKQVFGAVADEMQRVRDYARETAEENLKLYDSLRELQNLRKEGTTAETAPTVMGIMARTGLREKEAVDLLESFEGSFPAGHQKGNIRPGGAAGLKEGDPTLEAFKQEMAITAGQIGLKYGMDPKTSGDLAGVMGQYMPITSKEDVAGQFAALSYALNEGRGKVSALTSSSVGQAASLIGNGVADLSEIGALVSVGSTITKSEATAGTEVKRLNRALNRVTGKAGDTLKQFGLDKVGSDVEKLRTLAPMITGEGGDRWLSERGWGEQGDRKALIGFAKNLDLIDIRTKDARARAGMGGQEIAATEKWMANDPAVAARMGENSIAVSRYMRGLEQENLQIARKSAEGRLQNPNQPGGPGIDTFGTGTGDSLVDWFTTIGAPTSWFDPANEGSRQARIDVEASRQLAKSASDVGIDVESRYPGLSSGMATGGKSFAEIFKELSPDVIARGGNPYGDNSKEILSVLKDIRDQARQRGGANAPGGFGNNGGGAVVPRR